MAKKRLVQLDKNVNGHQVGETFAATDAQMKAQGFEPDDYSKVTESKPAEPKSQAPEGGDKK